MKRREFVLSAALLTGCTSSGTSEPTETRPETAEETENGKISDYQGKIRGLRITFLQYNTTKTLEYVAGRRETAKIHPENQRFAGCLLEITNTTDNPIDWYYISRVKLLIAGTEYQPVEQLPGVDQTDTFRTNDPGTWMYRRLLSEPPTPTLEPGDSTRHFPLYDTDSGDPTIRWEIEDDSVEILPISVNREE